MKEKKYQIKYLPTFYRQFNRIICYIRYKLKNPKAANQLIEKVQDAILDRSFKPEAYEPFKSNKTRKYKWYRIYVGHYAVFYTVIGDTMNIAKIIYSKRDLEKMI